MEGYGVAGGGSGLLSEGTYTPTSVTLIYAFPESGFQLTPGISFREVLKYAMLVAQTGI